jgi:exosortase B
MPLSKTVAVQWPVWSLGLLILVFSAMYVPTYLSLANSTWVKDENGHGPLILAMSVWLLWRDREAFFKLPDVSETAAGLSIMLIGSLCYVIGRSQSIDTVEVGSQILVLSAAVLLLKGWQGLRLVIFPVFFLVFMVPLPGVFAQIITLPLKAAVSYCAEAILYAFHYPIGRSGVTLVIGQYHLLVADACAGLSSIFTLEALGLFYMKMMNYKSAARNTVIAIMILPISFISNTVRVIILVLVTYYLGDEMGQGFVHGMAGMVLFAVALTLTYLFDLAIAPFFKKQGVDDEK